MHVPQLTAVRPDDARCSRLDTAQEDACARDEPKPARGRMGHALIVALLSHFFRIDRAASFCEAFEQQASCLRPATIPFRERDRRRLRRSTRVRLGLLAPIEIGYPKEVTK